MNRGFWAVLGAFLIWGLLPVYLKLLATVPALQIVAHRLVWCCFFAVAWLALTHRLPALRNALRSRNVRLRLSGSAMLISGTWLIYVWAVLHNHIVAASLGYFISPLANVLLGVTVLKERLSRVRWVAVALASMGVLWLTVQQGSPPWIALGLAAAFSGYGLIRKTAAVDAVAGLATETLLLAPIGILYLASIGATGRGAFGTRDLETDLLLVGAGLVTAVPLTLFSYGARQIRYSTVGLIQYLQPTTQLLLGIFIYGEPFNQSRLFGFFLIWSALALYTMDTLHRAHRGSSNASPSGRQG